MTSVGRHALAASALVSLLGGGACGDGGGRAVDAASPVDGPPLAPLVDISGKLGSAIALPSGEGGAPRRLLVLWSAIEGTPERGEGGAGFTVPTETEWELCTLPLPGLGDVPFKALAPVVPTSTRATVVGDGDPARFLQPVVAFVYGAALAHPATSALPAAGARRCATASDTGCLLLDATTDHPGVPVRTSGLVPDADEVYVDARVTFALEGEATALGALDGTASPVTIEWHAVGCHLRAGGDCSPSEIAQIDTRGGRTAVGAAPLRSRSHGVYFTCPQFAADPEAALGGSDGPSDAGAAASGTDGGLGASSVPTFRGAIQPDLDARGCATFGCHDRIDGPGRLHLIFAPASEAEREANWRAALPFTLLDGKGGPRLVTQTPLPAAMRARWLTWIAAGAPY